VSLQAVDLRFGYRARGADRSAIRPTIDAVTLAVPPGAFVGILGPNGSGKTTLLKLLAGAIAPDSGRVTLDGTDVRQLPKRQLAQRLAVVPQETYLAFDYSVMELVLMGRYAHLRAFEIEGPDDFAAAEAALFATDASHLVERAFWTLSGGEKQRVAIASALAQLDIRLDGREEARRPDQPAPILCLDEPTASQDLRHQIELSQVLARLNAAGVTIVLTSHDLRFAASVCNTLVLLAKGAILANGRPETVLTPALIGRLYDVAESAAAPFLPGRA
jgi:iron complex transport system ATP-binding protein